MKLPHIVLVTGTDTGVGKTVATAALASALQAEGRSVAVYKPCQSGDAAGDSDCVEITRLAGPLTAEAGVVLQEPLAPVPAAALDGITLPPIAAHAERIRELASTHDHVLVEGSGGLLVELDPTGGTLADLGSHLGSDATFVVVARPALGTLNHTALTLEALERRDLRIHGVILGTWPDDPGVLEHGNRATLGSLRQLLGVLPERAADLPPVTFKAASVHWLSGLDSLNGARS